MVHLLLILVAALVVGAIGFGVTWLVAGRDSGLSAAEPDDRAVPLPSSRPLAEEDVNALRFDATLRGYRMGQVDAALRRAAYDIGYKQELIGVLEAENEALRDGRVADADALREARSAAASHTAAAPTPSRPAEVARPDSSGAAADEPAEEPVPPANGAAADRTDVDEGDSTAEHVMTDDEMTMTKLDAGAVLFEADLRQPSAGRAK